MGFSNLLFWVRVQKNDSDWLISLEELCSKQQIFLLIYQAWKSVVYRICKHREETWFENTTHSGVIIAAHLWLHSLQIFWSANMPQNVFLNNCSCPVFCKEKEDRIVLDNLRGSLWTLLVIHFTYLKNFIKLICEVTKKFKSILKEKLSVNFLLLMPKKETVFRATFFLTRTINFVL